MKGIKSFSENFQFSLERQDAVKSGKFFGALVLAFLILTVAVSFVPIVLVENLVAEIVLFFLRLFGLQGEILFQEPVIISLSQGTQIMISDVCTGLLEIIVIVAAIAASVGIDWRKRLLGVAAAIGIAFTFNIARIVSTVLIIVNSSSLELIEFAHNVLFRVFLFVVIAGIYFFWFNWATKQEQKSQ